MEIILTNGASEIPLDQLAEGEYKAVLYSTDTTGIQYEMWTWFCIGSCWDDEEWDDSDVDVPEETDDWEDIDTNLVPICSVAWYAINDDSTGETGTFVERAPESGLYEIEVASGAHYGIAFVCEDPEGEMMKLVIVGPNGVTTSESEGSADGWIVFAVPEGMGGEYEFSFIWNDGHNVETGYVVVSADGDGSAGNLSENGTGLAGGVLPGFTSVLGISAMLGAAMVAARRKVA
jgi:hypothetical protein